MSLLFRTEKLLNSICYSFVSKLQSDRLRVYGVKVGKNVRFLGKVTLKIDGRAENIEIGDQVTFSGKLDLRNREDGKILIQSNCVFDDDVRIVAARNATVQIGARSAVGKNLIINAGEDVIIGEDCLFSSRISIHSSTHRCRRGKPISRQGYQQEKVSIGNDVWLSSNVYILLGTHLGSGCIVAPNSVLSGNYDPDSVLGGNPAKIIGFRNENSGLFRDLGSYEQAHRDL